MGDPTGFSDAQVAVARTFFELEVAEDFLLSGGGALLALGLSERPTEDLDVFSHPPRTSVADASLALRDAAAQHGWSVNVIVDEPTFSRLQFDVDG